jgi:phage-related protein
VASWVGACGSHSPPSGKLHLEVIHHFLVQLREGPPRHRRPAPAAARISDAKGIFRVMFVAKFEDAVYVLHCFQKKTQATTKHDKEIATARYRAVVNSRKTKP